MLILDLYNNFVPIIYFLKKIVPLILFGFFLFPKCIFAQEHMQTIVPILTYHRIQKPLKDTPLASKHFIVDPSIFEKQITYLHTHKYQTVTLDQYLDLLAQKKEIPKKTIIITFDDGYQSHYIYGYQTLKKYDFSGVFFIYTRAISNFPENMTWSELDEMYNNGMQIGNHTVSHKKLPTINNREISRREISSSKNILEKRVTGGKVVDAFAYPYGLTNSVIDLQVRETGHRIAVSDDEGINDVDIDLFHLRRHTVTNDMKNLTEFLDEVAQAGK